VRVLTFTATELEAGRRLDAVLAACFPTLSRTYIARLARRGHVTVNGLKIRPGYTTKCGDSVRLEVPPPQTISIKPEPIPLSILYEDAHIMVLDKPSGMVVHPGPGHHSGTIVNGVIHHCPDLEGIGGEIRPGIVHRLDKDTSGALVVAKSDLAHEHLSLQFRERRVKKRYLALVYGRTEASEGVIDWPIGRHPADRKKMSTRSRRIRSTETHWKVKEQFPGVIYLDVGLKTGRTHQIRVHCAAMGWPVVGDALYGGKKRWKEITSPQARHVLSKVGRQMLHAFKLAFVHPHTGEWLSFEAPLPRDMRSVLESLRHINEESRF
jgi:23S rRNA pseudouridine1911/1915/1917 synthase